MITENIAVRCLKAEPGKVLTDGETFSTLIYLSVHDNPEMWREITEEEAKRLQSELENGQNQK